MKKGVHEFENACATIRFIRTFDTLFDIMNTSRIRSDENCTYKSAINPQNAIDIFTYLKESQCYINSLKLIDNASKVTPILRSRVKTGFRGLVINILSITQMY